MSIRGIGSTDNPYENLGIVEKTSIGQAANRGEGVEKTASGDGVTVSADAKLLAAGYEAARQAPDVRADKVAQLKAQVASGEYRTDSRSIAERMLREDTDLG